MAHVHLYFTGFAKPVTVSKSLKAHVRPTPVSYFFPGKVADLRVGDVGWPLFYDTVLRLRDKQFLVFETSRRSFPQTVIAFLRRVTYNKTS